MSKKELQKAAGKRFADLLDKIEDGPTEFAKKVGKPVRPQDVNNWRRRGVPATRANLVAGLLGCRPEEISATVPAMPITLPTTSATEALSERQQILLDMCDGFSRQQMMQITQAAAWVREGRTLSATDPPGKMKGGGMETTRLEAKTTS